MRKYKHIIWDWNGTLLDDIALCVDVMNTILKKRSMPLINKEIYLNNFDFPVKEYYRKIGFNFIEESFEVVGTEFIIEYDKRQFECNLHKGAKEFLIKCFNEGIGQSILSAREQKALETNINYYNLTKLMFKIVGLQDHYAHSKIENGKQLIKELDYYKQDIILIGDTAHDYEVANNIGINCILISNGHHSKEKLTKCNTKVIDSISQLDKYIV